MHDVVVHLTCTLREIVDPAGLPGPIPGTVERTNAAALTHEGGREIARQAADAVHVF